MYFKLSSLLVVIFIAQQTQASLLNQLPDKLRQFLEAEVYRQSPWYPADSGNNNSSYTTDNIAVERYDLFERDMKRIVDKNGVVHVRSYRIPLNAVDMISSGNLPSQLIEDIEQGYVTFYIHPAAEEFYREWLKKNALNFEHPETVLAYQTSSMRSLLVVPAWKGHQPFIVKTSLPELFGGMDRRVPISDIVPAVSTTAMLDHAVKAGTFPRNCGYLPEPLGVFPKEGCDAGQLIRVIPKDFFDKRVVPLFALYGDPREYGTARRGLVKSIQGDPLLLTMLNLVNTSASNYLRYKLIKPFAKIWLSFVLDHGVGPEAHGQNTLLVLDENGMLTGEFYFRDLDGFSVYLGYREKLGLPSLGIHYLQGEYEEKDQFGYGVGWFNSALASAEYQIRNWAKEGWIEKDATLTGGRLGQILVEELDSASRELLPEITHAPFKSLNDFTGWQAKVMHDVDEGKIPVPHSILKRQHDARQN